MSVRLARFGFLGFGAVAATIAANLLLLQQDGQRPLVDIAAMQQKARADRARRLAIDDPTARGARHEPNAAIIDEAIPEPLRAPPSPDLVKALQSELSRHGYDPGSIDGTLGQVTRAAIMAYEHDQGLILTAEPSDQLLKRIRTGHAAGLALAPPGTPPRGAAIQVMRSAQEFLVNLGYAPGRADGRPGEATEQAIRAFEMTHGLVPSGRVSGELMQRFVAAATSRRAPAASDARRR